MKLKLKLSLLALLATLATTSIHAVEHTLSQDEINPDFEVSIQEDTVYKIEGDLDFSAITVDSSFTVTGTKRLTFQGDKSNNLFYSPSHALCLVKNGHLAFKDLNSLVFEGNATGESIVKASLLSKLSGLTMENINSISFKNFHSSIEGGVISDIGGSSGIIFKNIGDITFDSNSSKIEIAEVEVGVGGGGGAIFSQVEFRCENISGTIRFTNNAYKGDYLSGDGGGAIFSEGKINFINTGNILFEGNRTIIDESSRGGGLGGAIFSSRLMIANTGDVDFLNNATENIVNGAIGMGGAIYVNEGGVTMSADKGNITFKGNTCGLNAKKRADGLYVAWVPVDGINFRAQQGREIRFYDPLTCNKITNSAPKGTVNINKTPDDLSLYGGSTPDFSGAIRFSGEFVHEYITQVEGESNENYARRLNDSKYSNVNAPINLHNGTVIIEHGATLGARPDTMPSLPISLDGALAGNTTPLEWTKAANAYSAFNLLKGTLEIRDKGILSVKNASFSGRDAVIRADGKALLIADTVDMSKGFSFDFAPFFGDDKSGLFIIANSISLGGTLGVADTSIDHYSDRRWSEGHRFMVINIDGVTNISGSLDDIASNISGSEVVDSPYAYQGTWSYEWVGKELFAIWTPTGGGITDVDPELEGNIVSNSMWSSASNAKALSNTALENANILRFESTLRSNFWVKGIGDFAYDDSTAELDGYSYQGGGYAAGADFKLGEKSIVGVAFGQLMGDNKSELYISKIKQDSMMGSLYAAHLQTFNKRNSLLWTLAGTYGDTENSMNTHYSDGDNSSGSWNNNAYFVEAKMEWRIAPEGKNWTYKPFIGVEYTEVKLEGFTEVGDKAREFAEGAYKNIALPIGIGFEHQSHFGKKTWLNSLSLAYVPDVYREAPNTQATRLSNGFSWKDQGSKPSIHTLRATINSTLQLNASWTAYAGYTFEAREDASYHNVNAGVSYSF